MAATQRVDKWLWYARFYKSRSLCAKTVGRGQVRINDIKITKSSHGVAVGDVLSFSKADWERVIEVVDLGARRGSAPEAQTLYVDHSRPKPVRETVPQNPKFEGKGRPTKKDRRQSAAFTAKHLD